MKKISTHSGFTLLELVISFGVMSIVIFGVVSTFMTSIRANASQIDQFIAYSLAQEGLEGVRNIRDTYFRQALNWNGVDNALDLVDAPFLPGTYLISRKTPSQIGTVVPFNASSHEGVKKAMPWRFDVLGGASGASAVLYRVTDNGVTYYMNQFSGDVPTAAVASPFSRVVKLSVDGDRMTVIATVTWKSFGSDKKIDLVTEFTNWKQRPY